MGKTRQLIPEGLAEMPPGPELAAVLAGVDLSRLSGLDCVTMMRAQHRQATHEQARLLAAIAEVGRCGIGPDDQLPRMDAPDEFSADEIRGALVWTRTAANTQLSLAWDLVSRLPQVFATLDYGVIDVPKARVFSDWTAGLTDEQARWVCEELLPRAPELTTGQLIDRIKRLAIAIDPDWARRRYEEAVRDRKVIGYRNEDGSANLCGYQLPADRAAAACAHLDALAKKIKHAGDRRPIDHVRADLYLAMLDGSYTGWSEHDIITHMLSLAQRAAAVDDARAEQPQGERGMRRCRPGSHRRGEQIRAGGDDSVGAGSSGGCTGEGTTSDQTPGEDARGGEGILEGAITPPQSPSPPQAAAPPQAPPPSRASTPPIRRAGVEVRVEITTLLGLDDHPGELPGFGPIHAESARRLVPEQTAAEWRYAITDDDGHLVYEGITRRRPDGYPSRAASPCRGGIVELHVKLSDLRHLTARPARLGDWAGVLADLARQAEQHEHDDRYEHDDRPRDSNPHAQADQQGNHGGHDGRGPRSPGKPLRRHTEIRDRTCRHPRCRMPAHGTDGDHIEEWANGGATSGGNVSSACRHDHKLRHEGGWIVYQPRPGHLVWISRLGVHYNVRPPLIIEPLPDPIPRKPTPQHRPDDHDERADDPIWREPRQPPDPPAEPEPPPPPDPDEPIPF